MQPQDQKPPYGTIREIIEKGADGSHRGFISGIQPWSNGFTITLARSHDSSRVITAGITLYFDVPYITPDGWSWEDTLTKSDLQPGEAIDFFNSYKSEWLKYPVVDCPVMHYWFMEQKT